MYNKDISIIVPVYNVELYIEDCLQSALCQNFKDYEIICVDDASTDDSSQILQKYAASNSKIKIFTHSQNRGLSVARNTGLKNAQGKYIMFLDSDDMIAPNACAELFYAAEKNQVDIVYYDMVCKNEEGHEMGIVSNNQNYEYDKVYSGKELFCVFVESHLLKFEAWRQFIRRDFLKDQQIEFYEGILHEDELFSFLCAMNAHKVIDINKEYYIYRKRPGSITSNMDYKRAQSVFVVLVQIIAFWTAHNFTDIENQAIAKYYEILFNAYQYYLCFDKGRTKLDIGGLAEKTLYSLIYNRDRDRYLMLSDDAMEKIIEASGVIVFGAGKAAMDIINTLEKRNVRIDAIAVTNREANPDIFCGIKVDSIDNIATYIKDAVVIIGVTLKNSKGIQDKLEQLGFNNIIIPQEVHH